MIFLIAIVVYVISWAISNYAFRLLFYDKDIRERPKGIQYVPILNTCVAIGFVIFFIVFCIEELWKALKKWWR